MKNKTKLKFKIIFSFLPLALSFFSLITLTFSWFAMNKNSNAGGLDATISSSSFVDGCEFYSIVTDATGTGYYFKKAASDGDCNLGVYDILKDKYQLLIKVTLKEERTVYVTAKTDTDYFLGHSTAKSDGHWLTADGTGNVLSSVVSFAVLSGGDAEETSDGYRLSALPSETVCFYDKSTLSEADPAAPAPSVNVTASDGLSVSESESGEICFFILLSYDPLLMSTVFSVNIGNTVIEQGEDVVIPFTLDFGIYLT